MPVTQTSIDLGPQPRTPRAPSPVPARKFRPEPVPVHVRPYTARDLPVLLSWAAVHWGAVHPDALEKRLAALPGTLSPRGWVAQVHGQPRAMVWLYRTDAAAGTLLLEGLWRDPLAPEREAARAVSAVVAHGVAQARADGAGFLMCTTSSLHVARRARKLGAVVDAGWVCMLPLRNPLEGTKYGTEAEA